MYIVYLMTYTQRKSLENSPADILRFDGIKKHFGGTYALKGVSLEVHPGEIVALLGENGAGKSTLIKVLGGIHRPDAGQVSIGGTPYVHLPGQINKRQAVAFIHQDLGLIDWMSVAENIAFAVGYARKAGGLIDWAETRRVAERALKLVEANFPATARVSNLTRTEKSLVAIARALAVDCDFLVLDEPTASLPADEVERLFAVLERLRERGVGMIYVSHRLDEIFRIADRVAVLRDGEMVGASAVSETNAEELVHLIVGSKVREIVRPTLTDGTLALDVRDLQVEGGSPVSFQVRHGELVGLVGLRGAGHEDIGRALFGLAGHQGTITMDGREPDLSTPQGALESGFGFLARDRLTESIAPGLSIRENIFINPAIHDRGLFSLMRASTEARKCEAIGQKVELSPNDPNLFIEALSGGNQQKVVVGRWIDTGRRFLIAEDPTSGVDVGAKAGIYNLLFEALESGMGVLIVSTDFEEISNICHRALVFSRGSIVKELSGDNLTTKSLIQAASASEAAGERERKTHAIH